MVDAEPNNDSPLNNYAATMWDNQEGKGQASDQNSPFLYKESSILLCFVVRYLD